ncbi:MAG: substrate-binding domain-containing protein [Bifidobacteriaceae bacterium]|jgi:DNA-binding LacI/PurR family transcriptional regulator|nr:substrate-binding domain-containing protein [Bifidobacteriaceae bacterium]
MASGRPTLVEIARSAGVSAPTVSRVVNGRGGVSEATRQTVLKALSDLGYRRRHRVRRRSCGVVDVVISSATGLWATGIMTGAYAEAARLGIDIVATETHDRLINEREWIDRRLERGTDGIVLVVSRLGPLVLAEIEARSLPLVAVDPISAAPPGVPTVSATNWSGGRAATEHLIELGHRRIGVITSPLDDASAADRLDGYRAALRRAGIDYDPGIVREGNSLREGGLTLGGELLDLADRPTAIFSFADEQAFGVYEAARERGLTVPGDLSVVGFDDIPLSLWMFPQLTTVHQPLAEMARQGVRLVAALSEDRTDDIYDRVELATSLKLRESTAPPPAPRRTARARASLRT